jgi:hypothetical protein
MAFGSNHASQKDQIFNTINFMGTWFILNPTFVHHPLIVILIGQNIELYLFYNTNMLEKNKRCKQPTINRKVQAIFVNILVTDIFKYMLQVKDS